MGFELRGDSGITRDYPGALCLDTLYCALASSQNNFAPTDSQNNFATANTIIVTPSGAFSITGFQGGAEGRIITVINDGAFTITLPADDPLSAAVNRFAVAVSIAAGKAVDLQYLTSVNKWVPIGGSALATAGGGTVNSVQAGDGIDVDATDPANPIVTNAGVIALVAGPNISIDDTDPQAPIISASGGGGGTVDDVVAGAGISVDSSTPASPVVSLDFAYIRNINSRSFTSTTAAQKIFDSPTNGALTIATGTYIFDMLLIISSMSATSGNGTFSFAGTATLAFQSWIVSGMDAATLQNPASFSGRCKTSGGPAVTNDVTANTGDSFAAFYRGQFSVDVAGTIIPSFALATAAVASLAVSSYFRCQRVGANNVVSVGAWS